MCPTWPKIILVLKKFTKAKYVYQVSSHVIILHFYVISIHVHSFQNKIELDIALLKIFTKLTTIQFKENEFIIYLIYLVIIVLIFWYSYLDK